MSTPIDHIAEASAAPDECRTVRKKQTPERAHLHHCFNAWLKHPQIGDRHDSLMAAMKEHELKERLRRLLPPLPVAPAALAGLADIPVEEITFTNPNHRSTPMPSNTVRETSNNERPSKWQP